MDRDTRARITSLGDALPSTPDVRSANLSCRVVGFYPFAGGLSRPRGFFKVLAWLLKDVHQAVVVTVAVDDEDGSRSSPGAREKVRMDFMTKGGDGAEVWYNQQLQWRVLLGESIQGEVRIHRYGAAGRGAPCSQPSPSNPKLRSLIAFASRFDTRMNLYTNNCRVFAARVQQEAERLNRESESSPAFSSTSTTTSDSHMDGGRPRKGRLF